MKYVQEQDKDQGKCDDMEGPCVSREDCMGGTASAALDPKDGEGREISGKQTGKRLQRRIKAGIREIIRYGKQIAVIKSMPVELVTHADRLCTAELAFRSLSAPERIHKSLIVLAVYAKMDYHNGVGWCCHNDSPLIPREVE